ncbi:hypothetical protein KIN20_018559 [Parelaphostrongylus tenuis]|uniref:Uncharacterized protein n=1 Tax=Parelaphostrongylus tenuis TaxID=148309 RepID=A0AAD5MJP9_PARTN|nr:hypothetical protein KIN20_018559 [Parelaphostrongylus tenuis]
MGRMMETRYWQSRALRGRQHAPLLALWIEGMFAAFDLKFPEHHSDLCDSNEASD